jgi:hypothetical protein
MVGASRRRSLDERDQHLQFIPSSWSDSRHYLATVNISSSPESISAMIRRSRNPDLPPSIRSYQSLLGSRCSRSLPFICPPPIVFTASHDRIFHWILCAHARGHRLEQFCPVKPEEERRRIALLAALVDNSMNCGHEEVVGLPHEAICDVYYKRVWDRICFNPVAALAEYLQAARVVLCDDGETLDIGVGSDALLLVSGVCLLWIMEDTHPSFWSSRVVIEMILRQMKCESEDSGQASRELQELFVVRK